MISPGIYRHYKGPKYMVLAVAETHNHNGDLDVVYLSLEMGKYCTRPLRRDSRNEDSWLDIVMWPDGIERHRFIKSTMTENDGLEPFYERGPNGLQRKDPG
jgi:hypothetical protein